MKPDPFAHLVITRKRKKYKFAHFTTYENCFAHAKQDDPKQTLQAMMYHFITKQPLVLELAAGNAQFSLQLAILYPHYNFIAIDIKSDRLYTSAKQALQENITNIIFLRTHMNELPKLFKPGSVQTIWLTFPDPFPRKRSAKHRLTNAAFLKQYKHILQDGGTFRFKTDNRDLFLWSLEQLVAEKWRLDELTFDLHDSQFTDEYKIMTHYEQKFNALGIAINYLSAKKS